MLDLAKAADRTDLRETVRRIFRSLTIPSSKGGVMLDRPYGPVLEEYPHEQPLYVLNGWTSAAVGVLEYAKRVKAREATEFGRATVEAMLAILDKFDAPELANSRYGLAGHTWLRLRFDRDDAGARMLDGAIEVPSDGVFPFVRDSANRYRNWFQPERLDRDGRVLGNVAQLNALLSNIDPVNTLRVTIAVDQSTAVTLELPVGEYNPLANGMRITGWKPRETVRLEPGEHKLELAIPMSELPLIGYPTNFTKKLAGRHHNVYHFLHLRNMQHLLKLHPDPRMVDWLVRWLEYLARWPTIPEYADERIELSHVPNGHRSAFPSKNLP